MKLKVIALLAILVSGCSTIEHTTNIEQPINQHVIVGVGDVVLRVNKQKDLENAFGNADIFGRKTNKGFSELRFAGVEKSGETVLYRKDVNIITNETTMSRTPFSTTTGTASTNATGSYYGSGNYGSANANANTNYTSTTLKQSSDFHIAVPTETIPIRLNPEETTIPMEGYIVEIIKATPNSLEYRVIKH